MTPQYIKRSIEPVLKKAASEFPALAYWSPTIRKNNDFEAPFWRKIQVRIIGTSRHTCGCRTRPQRIYVDVSTAGDSRRGPERPISSYVKERIDEQRNCSGQYLITGSQNILLAQKVTESLAGRAAVLRLLPLSRREIEGRPQALLPWESGYRKSGQIGKQGVPCYPPHDRQDMICGPASCEVDIRSLFQTPTVT